MFSEAGLKMREVFLGVRFLTRSPLTPRRFLLCWSSSVEKCIEPGRLMDVIQKQTINAISMIRPSLKKNFSPAWDLAFSWLQDEPHVHHPALPLSVLLAMSTLSLLCWPTEAAIWLMTWIGLLRIGEVLEAVRSDLLLPRDSAPGIEHILLRIREPKTRGRGARHQSTRIEPQDAVALISQVFQDFAPSDKLWSFQQLPWGGVLSACWQLWVCQFDLAMEPGLLT